MAGGLCVCGGKTCHETVERDHTAPADPEEAPEDPEARAQRIKTEGKRAIAVFTNNELEFKQRTAAQANNGRPPEIA